MFMLLLYVPVFHYLGTRVSTVGLHVSGIISPSFDG